MVKEHTVDGKGRDAKNWFIDLDQLGLEATVLLCNHDTASNREVTVKPRVPDTASVGFHPHLEILLLGAFRDRTNLEGVSERRTHILKDKLSNIKYIL